MAKVDYEKVASLYQAGRSAVAHEEEWGPLLVPYLPDRPSLRVLDLGAGTGIFSRVWPEWGATSVVALDPARPMLAQARTTGLPPCAAPVNARGEWLPLQDGSVDVVWISTVFHHLRERERCAADLGRVVRGPGSLVMIRTQFPDRWTGGWQHLLPNIDRSIARFPRLDTVADLLAPQGFTLTAVEGVQHPEVTATEVADWLRKMRHADTLLLGLEDDEIAEGLAKFDALGDELVDGPTLETAVFALAA
jgi:SAM-dependent methyltransferase